MSGPAACDLLVVHGHLVTLDPAREEIADGAVAIAGRDILEVGSTAELRARYTPARTLDAGGGVVHPGFIDGHYHASIHLARGSVTDDPHPPDAGDGGPGVFVRWINALTDEDEYASALMAALELARNGFTGFVEAATAFQPDAIAKAAEAVGIRCSLGDCMLWDLIGGEPMAAMIPRAPCSTERAHGLLGQEARRRTKDDGLIRGHVALYGIGSASEELTLEAKRLADDLGTVFHQHQNFMGDDVAYDRGRFGRDPLVHLAEIGALGGNTILTHMNLLSDAEAEAVVESGSGIVWHPGNAMYYGIAPQAPLRMPALQRRGTPVALGTDVAKVWAFGDLGFVAYLVSREWGDYLPARAVLEMFAGGGAAAFGATDDLGRLAAGRRAALVIRTLDLPDAQPNRDPLRQAMLVSRTKGIDTVIVDGREVVRGGRALLVDEAEVYALARRSAARMAERAGLGPAKAVA